MVYGIYVDKFIVNYFLILLLFIKMDELFKLNIFEMLKRIFCNLSLFMIMNIQYRIIVVDFQLSSYI